jgi:hypothetical protein
MILNVSRHPTFVRSRSWQLDIKCLRISRHGRVRECVSLPNHNPDGGAAVRSLRQIIGRRRCLRGLATHAKRAELFRQALGTARGRPVRQGFCRQAPRRPRFQAVFSLGDVAERDRSRWRARRVMNQPDRKSHAEARGQVPPMDTCGPSCRSSQFGPTSAMTSDRVAS